MFLDKLLDLIPMAVGIFKVEEFPEPNKITGRRNDLRCLHLNKRAQQDIGDYCGVGQLLCEKMPDHKNPGRPGEPALIDVYIDIALEGGSREADLDYQGSEVDVRAWWQVCEQLSPGYLVVSWMRKTEYLSLVTHGAAKLTEQRSVEALHEMHASLVQQVQGMRGQMGKNIQMYNKNMNMLVAEIRRLRTEQERVLKIQGRIKMALLGEANETSS